MARGERRLSSDSSPNLYREAGDPSRYADRKQSIYFGAERLQALKEESARLDRSLSWLVGKCVDLAMDQIRAMPAMSDAEETSGDSSHLDSTDD